MSFSDTWRNAASETIEDPDRGNYQIEIVRGNAQTADGGDWAKLYLKILGGPNHVGNVIEDFMWFGHEVSAKISRERLLAYGLSDPETIESIEDLDDRIQTLIGTKAEIGVGYDKKGYLRIAVSRSTPPDLQSELTPDNGGFTERQTVPADDDKSLPF